MNSFNKCLQDHPGSIRLVVLLFVGINLYSAHRMFSASPLMTFAHVVAAVVLLQAAILVH